METAKLAAIDAATPYKLKEASDAPVEPSADAVWCVLRCSAAATAGNATQQLQQRLVPEVQTPYGTQWPQLLQQ